MNWLWIIFSTLLPCSGLLHFFGIGYYAPGALLLLAPLGMIELLQALSQRRIAPWQIFLLLYAIIYACSGAYFASQSNIEHSYIVSRELVTLLGSLSFLGIGRLFERTSTPEASRWLMIGVDFTLLVLVIEALAIGGIIPAGIKETGNLILAGRSTFRLQGPAQEASFVAAYLATLFPYAWFHFRRHRRPRHLIRLLLMIGALFAILSLQGLFVWVAGAFAGLLYAAYSRPRRVIFSVSVAAIVVLLTLISAALVRDSDQGGYVASRVAKLKQITSPADLLFLDYSVFNRATAPYYGVVAGLTHPLGVGPGGYGAYYNRRLASIADPRVDEFLRMRPMTDAEDTKSLIIQYFAETGILTIVLILSFALCWRNRMRASVTREEKILSVSLLGCFIAMAVNGGSMLNFAFWICLVPCYSSVEEEEDSNTIAQQPSQSETV